MHERSKQLRALMAAHQLVAQDVATMTGRSLQTVQIWLSKGTTRPIPAHMLQLVEMQLAARGNAQ